MITFRSAFHSVSQGQQTNRLNLVILLCAFVTAAIGLSGCAGVVSQSATAQNNPTPVTIGVNSLPSGTAQIAYSTVLSASGGTKPYSWSVSSGSLPRGLTLNAAGQISGTPTAAGTASFAVRVSDSSSPVESATANLSITISSAGSLALTVTPGAVAFGNVAVGSTNSQTLQLSNTGGNALTISQIVAAGTGFSVASSGLPIALNAGQSTTATAKFSPAASGGAAGSVSVVSNAPNSPAIISLSGTGVVSTLTLSFSTTSIAFGSVNTGSSATQNVTVTNTGNANVQISRIGVSGTGFSLTGASAVTLTPKQSLGFSVVFSPTTATSATGSVTITSNAQGSPATITLTGTGVTPVQHSVLLDWTASGSANATGYNVYRSTGGSGYTKLNSSPLSALTYTDATVQNSQTYDYVVTAVDASGNESPYSDVVQMLIP